jgi:type VI secretion system secreted protein VgrG
VSSQSQDGATRMTADKTITVASIAKSVSIAAEKHVLLTSQGAYIKLCGGNIELHGPGKVEFKATAKELGGPQSSSFPRTSFLSSVIKPNSLAIECRYHDEEPLAGAPFLVRFADGSSRSGTLDGGGSSILNDVPPGAAEVWFGAMPGAYQRKDMTPTPNHNPRPGIGDIDALIAKYAPDQEGSE